LESGALGFLLMDQVAIASVINSNGLLDPALTERLAAGLMAAYRRDYGRSGEG
jgi:hypothetical protein